MVEKAGVESCLFMYLLFRFEALWGVIKKNIKNFTETVLLAETERILSGRDRY